MWAFECFVKFTSISIFLFLVYMVYFLHNNQNILKNRKYCVVPPHPSSGWWLTEHKLNKNHSVRTGTVLNLSCDDTYILDGSEKYICIEGNWFPKFGKCKKTCPSMFSSSMIKIRCYYHKKPLKDCVNPIDNTVAKFTCPPFYEDERKIRFNAICKNGFWSEMIPQCIPVCGQKQNYEEIPLIINGTEAEKNEFPWQIAIYRSNRFICGGTLLHEKLILTAAHCVYNDGVVPEGLFDVIAGSCYREFINASTDLEAQISSVNKIFCSETYRGPSNRYSSDIALIIPTKSFNLSMSVQPICIDWLFEYTNQIFEKKNYTGIVPGWGYTREYDRKAPVLRNLEVPIVPQKKCRQDLRKSHLESVLGYIQEDKICAGYINMSKSLCRGDSGSGLVININNKYYILGIVSISLKGDSPFGGCNSQSYSFHTNVSYYLEDFIWEIYALYKPYRFPIFYTNQSTERPILETTVYSVTSKTPTIPPTKILNTSCILPPQPNFGNISVYGNLKHLKQYAQGSYVKTGTILKIKCHKNYKLDGDKMIACENGSWSSPIGICLKMCPSLNNTNMNISCYYKIRKLHHCKDPVHGTSAKYQCEPFYEDLNLMEHPLFCMDGKWSPRIPQCLPKCGERSLTEPAFDDTIIPKKDFSWEVFIYEKTNHTYVCSGTLLSQKLIITSSDCFPNKNIDQYLVVAGKYFKEFNISKDLSNTQTSEISSIEFKDNNFAFIYMNVLFKFSMTVQPVCIDWERKLRKGQHLVTSWMSSDSGTRPTLIYNNLLTYEECKSIFPNKFMNMTEDKLCVRPLRMKELDNSGGGLFLEHNNRHYLIGIKDSTSPKMQYDNYIYLYTSVENYKDLIMSKIETEMF